MPLSISQAHYAEHLHCQNGGRQSTDRLGNHLPCRQIRCSLSCTWSSQKAPTSLARSFPPFPALVAYRIQWSTDRSPPGVTRRLQIFASAKSICHASNIARLFRPLHTWTLPLAYLPPFWFLAMPLGMDQYPHSVQSPPANLDGMGIDPRLKGQ